MHVCCIYGAAHRWVTEPCFTDVAPFVFMLVLSGLSCTNPRCGTPCLRNHTSVGERGTRPLLVSTCSLSSLVLLVLLPQTVNPLPMRYTVTFSFGLFGGRGV